MRRSTLRSALLVVLIDAALLVFVVHSFLGAGAPTPAHGSPPVASSKAATSTTTPSPPRSNSSYQPLRVRPPQTAVERAVNAAMVKNSLPGLAVLTTAKCPSPATSTRFRSIGAPVSSSATLYAMAFTQELLDLDFATSTRDGLLAWANDNNAPNTLMGLPTSLSTKVLCVSLTTGPSPVPTAAAWNLLAKNRTTWRVSGLVVSVNPAWIQAMNSGWTSIDPLMVVYDVSGLLTVTKAGHPPVVKSIAFALTLGGASLHPGYGAVALDYWTVN
ncbi:MAG: hypothetical protein ACYC1I_12825 [Acidimicrobiales bacterium]